MKCVLCSYMPPRPSVPVPPLPVKAGPIGRSTSRTSDNQNKTRTKPRSQECVFITWEGRSEGEMRENHHGIFQGWSAIRTTVTESTNGKKKNRAVHRLAFGFACATMSSVRQGRGFEGVGGRERRAATGAGHFTKKLECGGGKHPSNL